MEFPYPIFRRGVAEIFDSVIDQPLVDQIAGLVCWRNKGIHFRTAEVISVPFVIGIRNFLVVSSAVRNLILTLSLEVIELVLPAWRHGPRTVV